MSYEYTQLIAEIKKDAPSIDRIRQLVETHPDLVKVPRSVDGSIPLHIACEYKAPLDVVQFLVKQWPDSVKTADIFGNLPLHKACANKASLAVIQYLVQQWPESVKHRNSEGKTPVDMAALQQQAVDVVTINWLELPWRDHRFTEHSSETRDTLSAKAAYFDALQK